MMKFIVTIILVAAGVLIYRQIQPDVQRYLRLRSM